MAKVTDLENTDDLAVTLYRNSLESKNTDFSIVVGNTTINCHASVVCARSSYFDSLYSSGIRRASLDEYILSKDGAIVKDIVRYLYLGTIDLSTDTVLTVVQAAKFIKCDKLIRCCENFMIATLDTENYRNYSAAITNFSLHDLRAACKEFPGKNFSALIPTPWFIPSLSASELLEYIRDDDLVVSREDDVLEALRKWLDSSKETDAQKEEHLERIIPYVRLSYCDPQKLTALQKDKRVPAVLRLKLSEFQNERGKRKGEKKRNRYTTAPITTSPHSARDDDSIVVVGGRIAGNEGSDQITYLNEQQQNMKVTNAEGYGDLCVYSVCFSDEEITISGGYSNTKQESIRGINSYNTRTRRWRKLPDMRQPTSRHVSLFLHQMLYIIAGCFESPVKVFKKWYQQVDVLDLVTGVWRKASEIPHAVIEAGAGVVNGQIVVTGGLDSDEKRIKKTVRYNPTTDQWRQCASMPESRASADNSTVAVGNRLFVLARCDFLVYDINIDAWTTLTAPPVPSYFCAMLLHHNTLVVLGGREEFNGDPHGRIQRYDLSTRKWSLAEESMTIPLSSHYACLMKIPK